MNDAENVIGRLSTGFVGRKEIVITGDSHAPRGCLIRSVSDLDLVHGGARIRF